MMNFRKASVCGALLLFGAAGCADLVVDNSNAPDRRRALATPGDVQSLINGSYRNWYEATHTVNGPLMVFSISAFQHSSTAANFGMLNYSKIPRIPIQNSVTHADYGNINFSWQRHYRALAAVAEGLRVMETDPRIAAGMGANAVRQNQVFAKLVQGMAHADLALVYDRAYIVDEDVAVIDENGAPVLLGEPVSYQQVMAAALGYLDEVIALASDPAAASLTIPGAVMARAANVTMPEVVRLAHSLKARYRANVARTPADRAAVNWAAVISDAENGITADWTSAQSVAYSQWTGSNDGRVYMWASTWQQMPYMIWGMADQSGNYQEWLSASLTERNPIFADNRQVLVHTPDLRFPQGATVAAQASNPGTLVGVRVNAAGNIDNAVQFSNAERGTWRWSQYYVRAFDAHGGCQVGNCIEISAHEMRLLRAEGHYRLGELEEAAALINVTRVAAGLSAADPAEANDGNSSCVPRLADESCGDLFEMLKWEKRLSTWAAGPYLAPWYFDGRGWGDLYPGTALQLPIPAEQISTLQIGASYTFGGVGGTMAAPGNPRYYGNVE